VELEGLMEDKVVTMKEFIFSVIEGRGFMKACWP
jgi:hypothetical protein